MLNISFIHTYLILLIGDIIASKFMTIQYQLFH